MLIVAGYPRTGTSILFKCLEKSGFNGGTEDDLKGHYYKSQHIDFGDYSHQLTIFASRMGIPFPLRARDLPTPMVLQMQKIGTEMEDQGINLIKDPNGALATQAWIDAVPTFKNPEFIMIERDGLETAKSCIRLWHKLEMNKSATVRLIQHTYELHKELWEKTSRGYPKITINHAEFFDNLESVKKRVSKFIGREFDTSLIDPNKTYAASKEIY